MGQFDHDPEMLEQWIYSLNERVSILEAEIKRMRVTPIKIIEARAWAVVYEIRCRRAINGEISMSTFDVADFLQNGIEEEILTMPYASKQHHVVVDIMKLAVKLDPNITIDKTGPKRYPVWRIIYHPEGKRYTLKDLFKDYS